MKLKSRRVAGERSPAAMPIAAMALTAAIAVSACGGGGSSTPPAPQNAAPAIGSIGAQSIDQDTATNALAFSVTDDSGPGGVTLTATSSNAAIIPVENIALGGVGGSRTVAVTPAEDATGTANVTVTGTDPQGLKSTSVFAVTVRAVQKSVASYTLTTFAQSENDTPVQVSGFTFTQDADDETTFAPLLQ